MLQYDNSLPHFWLINWSFFVHSTTRNTPYVQMRLDSILELCQTFPNDLNPCAKYDMEQYLDQCTRFGTFHICANARIQRCKRSKLLSEPSLTSILHVWEQRRPWPVCAYALTFAVCQCDKQASR